MSESNYHVHAFVGIIVNGKQIALPDGLGMKSPGADSGGVTSTASCFYYLHTHEASGVVHIEDPSNAAGFKWYVYEVRRNAVVDAAVRPRSDLVGKWKPGSFGLAAPKRAVYVLERAPSTGSGRQAEAAAPKIVECLLEFVGGVHDEGSVTRNRLA